MYFLQIVDTRKQDRLIRGKCMESVKRFVTGSDTYTVKEVQYNNDPAAMIKEIDKIRFTFAKEYDDLLYVNPDCFLFALPTTEQLNEDKIIIAETIVDNKPSIDTFLFYVNGQKTFFAEHYEELIESHSPFSLSSKQIRILSDNCIQYEPFTYSYYSFMELETSINNQFTVFAKQIQGFQKEVNAYRVAMQNVVNTMQLYDDLHAKEKENSNG